MKFLEKIQGLLPLGYLYLIILGLIKESILFNHFGISILKYSSITDILISPIADITSKVPLIIVVIVLIVLLFTLQQFMIKKSHKNWIQKLAGRKQDAPELSKAVVTKKIYKIFLVIVAVELFALFIGLGLGQGSKTAKKIKDNQLEYNCVLNFGDEQKEDVYLIDVNSLYYFYVSKGEKRVKIAPIGAVKYMEVIDRKK